MKLKHTFWQKKWEPQFFLLFLKVFLELEALDHLPTSSPPPGLFLGRIKCINPEKNENLKKFYSFWFFLELEALDHLPSLILASSPPQVCFWVVPMPKSWKNKKNENLKKFYSLWKC